MSQPKAIIPPPRPAPIRRPSHNVDNHRCAVRACNLPGAISTSPLVNRPPNPPMYSPSIIRNQNGEFQSRKDKLNSICQGNSSLPNAAIKTSFDHNPLEDVLLAITPTRLNKLIEEIHVCIDMHQLNRFMWQVEGLENKYSLTKTISSQCSLKSLVRYFEKYTKIVARWGNWLCSKTKNWA